VVNNEVYSVPQVEKNDKLSLQESLSRIGDENTAVVGLFKRGNSVLVGLRNYTQNEWKNVSVWTFPGGRCDEGESLETTLRRETKEEIDIKKFNIVDYLGDFDGAKDGDKLVLFLAETDEEPKLMEPKKFTGWAWMPMNEIPEEFFINKQVWNFMQENYNLD